MASFYLQAASILDELSERQNSLKAIIASLPAAAANGRNEKPGGRPANSRNDSGRNNDQASKRRLLALCANTLAYKEVLSEVADKVQLRKEKDFKKTFLKGGAGFSAAASAAATKGSESGRPAKKPKLTHDAEKSTPSERSEPSSTQPSADSLLLVLLHDLLIVPTNPRSKSTIQTSATYPPTSFLLSHRARLHSQLVRTQISRGASNVQQLRSDQEEREKAERVPRWVRLNTARGAERESVEMEWKRWLRERSLKEVESEGTQWLEDK
jgi:hypothetical protein